MLQKFRRLQIRGVQGEAVYAYCESWTTKEMWPPKLSQRVKIDRYIINIQNSPKVTFATGSEIIRTNLFN